VPVQVAGISGELQRHTVAVQDEFLREVVLSGPPEAIARIDAGQARIVAFVHLDSRDLDRRIETKRVSLWMLPKGVSVQRVGDHEGSDPEVRLSIAPGATTPEPGQLPAALGADSRATDPRPADRRRRADARIAAAARGGAPRRLIVPRSRTLTPSRSRATACGRGAAGSPRHRDDPRPAGAASRRPVRR